MIVHLMELIAFTELFPFPLSYMMFLLNILLL
jgi:hypothetical protein